MAHSALAQRHQDRRDQQLHGAARLPEPYRQGWQLALEQINAAGGVLGSKIESIFRDDGGKPEDASSPANDLYQREKVDLLSGAFLSNIGLAISDFANQNKMLYVASEPFADAVVWAKGNRYTFRLRPSTYMQAAMLVEEAAKLPAKKWATSRRTTNTASRP